MPTWMARVQFPDGSVRYAAYCEIFHTVLDDLYDRFATVGRADPDGVVIRRAAVAGFPEPRYPGRPLSDVDELVPVQIDIDPDGQNWAALFCPLQNQLIGPMNGMVIGDMQRKLALISQEGKLHLAVPGSNHSFCGQEVIGKEVPFRDTRSFDGTGMEEAPVRRDLYAEWHDGVVCRHCLTEALIMHDDWSR